MSTMPDQSFRAYSTSDLTVLTTVETAIAKYANEVMTNLGKRQPLPGSPPGAASAGFFPHGSVDWKKNAFTPAGTPALKPADMALDYPSKLEPGGEVTIVEASEYLVLTQQEKLGVIGRCFPVPDTHLIVYGDVVCIHGKITLPGKHVVIVARELRTLATKAQKAELNVDGGPLEDPSLPPLKPAPAGQAGAPAKQDVLYHFGLSGGKVVQWQPVSGTMDSPGGKGWSGDDVLNDFGEVAEPGHPEMHGKDGARGKEGHPGGDIYIVCDTVGAYSALSLSAGGGHGGRGQAGQDGGRGGRGGPGADGTMKEKDSFSGVFDARSAVAGGPGGNGGHGGIGGPGGIGGSSGNCTVIVNWALGEGTQITYSLAPGEPGERGLHGAGGTAGPDGSDGKLVSKRVGSTYVRTYAPSSLPPKWWSDDAVFKFWASRPGESGEARFKKLQASGKPLPRDLVTPPAKSGRYLLIHDLDPATPPDARHDPLKSLQGVSRVSHLHMLLETARLRYLQWDAYRFAGDAQADRVKSELQARLDFLGLGLRLLPKYVSEDDAQVRDGINATLARFEVNLAREWDYFGKSLNDVPLGSPDLYLEPFNRALTLLQEREATYLAYLDSLDEARALSEQRDAALAHADDDLKEHEADYHRLRATLIDLIKHKIPATDQPIAEARDELNTALSTLQGWVKTCFGLTAEDFIECLFNLNFIQGKFSAFATLGSQGASMINKAINKIPNDEGQAVDRKHVLMQVDTFTKQLSKLDEAWTVIQDARHPSDPERVQLNDPDAYRLLVAQQDLDNMLQQFYTKDAARAAMEAMDSYVDAVQQRNALLADYNTLVTEYVRVAGEIKKTRAQKDEVANLKAQAAQPNLPAETAFITALYNRTRERCIEQCYLASRAYRFWTLQPDTALYETLKLGTPNEITYQVLSGVQETLYASRVKKIAADLQNLVQHFPPEEADYRGTGISVVLTPRTHPAAFRRLKRTGVASFALSPPTKDSTKQQNPFVSHANVRITRVRAWILGVETDDTECLVHLCHKGEEAITRVDNTVVAVSHEPVWFKFKYDWTKVLWNYQAGYVENPEASLVHGGEDGNLVLQGDYANSHYLPLVGPFAQWEIRIEDRDNRGLNRSEIAAICLDFHGFSQPLNA